MQKKDRLYPAECAALLALCCVLLSGVWARGRQEALSAGLVRLHVIAVSDSAEDQAAKLSVRDAVLARLEPALENAASAGDAAETLRRTLPELEDLAAETAGVPARASLTREYYPTREYESFSLPAGRYLSLRIVLGEGKGRNWWCVVYPPLCEAGTEAVRETGAIPEDDLRLITAEDGSYEIRFRVLEWWGQLRSLWDQAQTGGRRDRSASSTE